MLRGAALTCSALQDPAYSEERSRDSKALLSAKEAVSLWVLGARKVGLLSPRTGLFFIYFIVNFLNTVHTSQLLEALFTIDSSSEHFCL